MGWGWGLGWGVGSPLKCNGWLAEGWDFEQRAPSPSARDARSSRRAPHQVDDGGGTNKRDAWRSQQM